MWFWGSMGFRAAVISGALACLLSANSALGLWVAGTKNTAPEFGKTLPPVGFVKFCATNPGDCKTRSAAHERIAMSPERWNQLYLINSLREWQDCARSATRTSTAKPSTGPIPPMRETAKTTCCSRSVSWKGLGFSAEALLITVVLDEKNEGHAILTVTTDAGDYVLDNRFDKVSRWNDTTYKFLKRQSHANPLQWVALVKQSTSNSGFVASGN